MRQTIITAAALLLSTQLATAQTATTAVASLDRATVDRYVDSMFGSAPEAWRKSNTLDETQRICSETRNNPNAEQEKAILARESAAVVLPTDGRVLGDWKRGRIVAQRGTGGQFSDQPDTFRGGNCYACHQLSRAEVSYGTLGPSLLEYGKLRNFAAEEAKKAYIKVYNAQAVLACSMMPRFGSSGFLTEQQIKDVVAYMFDPESPVNK